MDHALLGSPREGAGDVGVYVQVRVEDLKPESNENVVEHFMRLTVPPCYSLLHYSLLRVRGVSRCSAMSKLSTTAFRTVLVVTLLALRWRRSQWWGA